VASVTSPAGDLSWLLDDLIKRVPATRQAIALSADGLLLGASAGITQEEADHLAALAAGFASLARGASQHFSAGPVRQTIVEMEAAFLFVTSAGKDACLAVLAEAESDIGVIAYEMAMLVTRVGQYLSAPSRPVPVGHDRP
jgi:predicted regulator of Ras-like GTPase activity (Roadblock/LC7/MglB family)